MYLAISDSELLSDRLNPFRAEMTFSAGGVVQYQRDPFASNSDVRMETRTWLQAGRVKVAVSFRFYVFSCAPLAAPSRISAYVDKLFLTVMLFSVLSHAENQSRVVSCT